MSLRLPRLAQIVADFKSWYFDFQIWWQQVCEAIEAHEATQDQLITDLEATDATLAATQADLATAQADLAATQADLTAAVADIVTAQAAAEAADAAAAAAAADAAAAQSDATAAQSDATDALGLLNGSSTGPYVTQDVGPAWTAATGTASRATFAAYAGQTVSNPPTQAEVQAIDDHVKILSQRIKAIVDDLKTNGALT